MGGMIRPALTRFLSLLHRWRKEPLIPLVLLMMAGSLWVFAELSDEIAERDTGDFDRKVLLSMREPGDPSNPIGSRHVEEIGRDVTALGGMTVLTGLTIASAGMTLLLGKPRLALLLVIAIASGMILSDLLKAGFDRPRPDLVPHGSYVTSRSFPSGHAMMSAVVYLTLGLLLARTQRKDRVRVYLVSLSVFVTIMVGISRVYLGVHWPTDVLAGWSIGAAWALLFWLVAIRIDPVPGSGVKT
ncbi:MAG TPA: phosphatase PAP2 family protein [Chthoniobacterales bacterium]|jgi:undecaprenyl-diphosphatase